MRGIRALLAVSAAVGMVLALPGSAQADLSTVTLAQATTVGVHNTYDPSAYPYLARSLDAGASLVELDAWSDFVDDEWKVSHSDPFGNANNCVSATSAAQLYSGSTNQDLASCLDDIRLWFGAHPGHGPVMVKIELKWGFEADYGMGPAALDATIAAHLGAMVYKPADLLAKPGGGTYASLDAAARADNWPTRAALAGKAIIEIIPGTVEESNPLDTLWTDTEYAQYLKGLAAQGKLRQAQIFPSVHNAQSGDPRTRYPDTTLRPWFVVFDGDASTYVTSINTAWYDTNHYLVVMTDAQNVAPAISDTTPTLAQAQARVALLAANHASYVSCDWRSLHSVLGERLPRG
jgi:hypothetical protein